MEIPVFGKEQYPLNRESGLSYTISDIYKHVPIHTHTLLFQRVRPII
mgnify:CR=1 FL=1